MQPEPTCVLLPERCNVETDLSDLPDSPSCVLLPTTSVNLEQGEADHVVQLGTTADVYPGSTLSACLSVSMPLLQCIHILRPHVSETRLIKILIWLNQTVSNVCCWPETVLQALLMWTRVLCSSNTELSTMSACCSMLACWFLTHVRNDGEDTWLYDYYYDNMLLTSDTEEEEAINSEQYWFWWSAVQQYMSYPQFRSLCANVLRVIQYNIYREDIARCPLYSLNESPRQQKVLLNALITIWHTRWSEHLQVKISTQIWAALNLPPVSAVAAWVEIEKMLINQRKRTRT